MTHLETHIVCLNNRGQFSFLTNVSVASWRTLLYLKELSSYFNSYVNYIIYCNNRRTARTMIPFMRNVWLLHSPTHWQTRVTKKNTTVLNSSWRLNMSRFAKSAELDTIFLQKHSRHFTVFWGNNTVWTVDRCHKTQTSNISSNLAL